MNNLDSINFELNGQESNIQFNQPHWSDNDDNFMKCVGVYYIDKNGKTIRYKDDLID